MGTDLTHLAQQCHCCVGRGRRLGIYLVEKKAEGRGGMRTRGRGGCFRSSRGMCVIALG